MAHGCELPPYGLNGFAPSLDMDSARDRVVSILLGNLVVYVIFTTIWPKSALLDVRVHLSRILSTLAEIAARPSCAPPSSGPPNPSPPPAKRHSRGCAATALAQAAQTTYDAAFSAYQASVGNIRVATEADSGLLTARQAQSDAHAVSLVAAANLAFALGAMTSSDVASGLVAR